MSIWIDQKYIGTLSVRLDKFVRKDNYTYNFRCPICGDSQTNRNKARGYIFAQKGWTLLQMPQLCRQHFAGQSNQSS